MTKKKRTKVSRELRESITLESLDPGCDLIALAEKYKLARSTLIKWRRQYEKQQEGGPTSQGNPSFVEVKVERSRIVSTLKIVELILDNHRCCIEGKLNSTQLLKLVELLEEDAC